ncbi:MAG: VWA domain-containing protein [Promethearchaeota archaeon]
MTTTDVIDEFGEVNLVHCQGEYISVLVDLDEDGNPDTQIVFTIDSGQGSVVWNFDTPPTGKWFAFSNINCNGTYPFPERGEIRIHFVDSQAAGWLVDDPSTWVYKRIFALSIKASTDYTSLHPQPFLSVRAYRNRDQDQQIEGYRGSAGSWRLFQFTDPLGIEELHVTTDFAENNLDELILYSTEQPFTSTTQAVSGVSLLIDTSGSMAWSHEGNTGVPPEKQRLNHAKNAIIPFLDLLGIHGTGQKLGMATFPNHPWQSGTGCTGQLLLNLLDITDFTINYAQNTILPQLVAEGNTPLLAGISTAIENLGELCSGILHPTSNKAIVLLSDGYHNCPGFIDPGSSEVQDLVKILKERGIRVYVIGFGRPSDLDHPLLEFLASETGGLFYDVTGESFDPMIWDPATELHEVYKEILVDCLRIEGIIDPLGILAASDTYEEEVRISTAENLVTFYLSWVSMQKQRLIIEISSSDGQLVPLDGIGVTSKHGGTYTLVTIDESFLRQNQKVNTNPWKIKIIPNKFKSAETEKYHFSVIGSSFTQFRPYVRALSFETGAKILLQLYIERNGKPITNLHNVQVVIRVPETSLGTWFYQNKVSKEEFLKYPKKIENELLVPFHRKMRIIRDKKIPFPREKDSLIKVQLKEISQDKDSKYSPGIYQGIFADTKIDGKFTFTFMVNEATKDGISLQRNQRITKFLHGKFSPRNSIIQHVKKRIKNEIARIELTLIPKDEFGHFIGPGHAGYFSIKYQWAKPVSELKDNSDGTYIQIFDIPECILPDARFKIRYKGKIWKLNLTEKEQTLR